METARNYPSMNNNNGAEQRFFWGGGGGGEFSPFFGGKKWSLIRHILNRKFCKIAIFLQKGFQQVAKNFLKRKTHSYFFFNKNSQLVYSQI